MRKIALETPYESNPSVLYAAIRNILLRKGKNVEVVANYEPSLHYVSEWWKQLFGESEGQGSQGNFPGSCGFDHGSAFHGTVLSRDGARIMFRDSR